MCAPSSEANSAGRAKLYPLQHPVGRVSAPSDHAKMAGVAYLKKTVLFATFCEHPVRSQQRGERGQMYELLLFAAFCAPRMPDCASDAAKMLHWPANRSRPGDFAWVFEARVAGMLFSAVVFARAGGKGRVVSGPGFITLKKQGCRA